MCRLIDGEPDLDDHIVVAALLWGGGEEAGNLPAGPVLMQTYYSGV